MVKKLIYAGIFILMVGSCDHSANKVSKKWTLMTLEPGHFHASLIQKSMTDAIDSNCYVFGSSDSVVKPHLDLIAGYNNRPDDPTTWNPHVYIGNDFLAKMLQEKPGNIVVLAGNNKLKTEYIAQSAAAGINVLADKPMAINVAGFKQLKESFDRAEKENVLIYDIMTERYDIYAILQKELIHEKSIFGDLKPGSLEDPTIVKKSLHHFYKEVSGKPLIRPTWYYDTEQEGEGLVDVTTHAIDLIQWQSFPEQLFDYERDIEIYQATRWSTAIAKDQFSKSTGANAFPSFLSKDLRNDTLQVYSNGEINYSLKGIHAKVQVEWAFQATNGAGDTHTSEYKGTRSTITIRQD
ncbi:MAG: putative oxidoreductase C-terminal domain-containing protein, partial [Sphingobacterium sp.]